MNISAFDEWTSLFTEEIKEKWTEERKELRKISMVFHVLKKEFKNFINEFGEEIDGIRIKLNEKDEQNLNQRNIFAISGERENCTAVKTEPLKEQIDFFNIGQRPRTSPTLIKNRFVSKKPGTKAKSLFPESKQPKLSLNKSEKCNTTIEDIIDDTIIEEAPEVKRQWKTKKRKKNNTTLTQMFLSQKKQKTDKLDENGSHNADSMTADDTITYINKPEICNDKNATNIKVEQEFSEPIARKIIKPVDSSPDYAYEQVVRGKERKKLKGWSCKECENFYKFMDLSEEELEKRLNDCSKHRSKFQPRNETVPGFWDMTITSPSYTQSSQRSMVFSLKK